eukprot:1823147-Rhodomonas_salina.1
MPSALTRVLAQHGPSHAPKATMDRSPHPATSDSSMAAAMKKDLDSKVGTDIHSQWKTDQKKEQAGFSKTTKAFKVRIACYPFSSPLSLLRFGSSLPT